MNDFRLKSDKFKINKTTLNIVNPGVHFGLHMLVRELPAKHPWFLCRV